MSRRNSVVLLASTPVKSVSTREEASCASGVRLFGPWYRERNAGCHCVIIFAWPEIQNRLDSECGKSVGGSPEDESSAGAWADCGAARSAGASWARAWFGTARHTS